MSSNYKQKINKLEEYEPFFKTCLDDEVIKSIQYISHRKNNYKWILLVGINNLDFSEKILSFASRILLDIKKDMKEKNEDKKIPKDIQIFEYNLQKAREKKEERKEKMCAWEKDPLSFFETTEEEEKVTNSCIIKAVEGIKYIMPINFRGSSLFEKTRTRVLAYLLLKKWDFIVMDRYENYIIYLKVNDMYWKFKLEEINNIQMLTSYEIGFCELRSNCYPTKVTQKTYEKWKMENKKLQKRRKIPTTKVKK